MVMSSLIFPSNHELLESFDDQLQHLTSGGLIDYFTSFYNEFLDPKRYEHLYPIEPKVLSLELLEAGFVIWLVSISISVVVFILELITSYVTRKLKMRNR